MTNLLPIGTKVRLTAGAMPWLLSETDRRGEISDHAHHDLYVYWMKRDVDGMALLLSAAEIEALPSPNEGKTDAEYVSRHLLPLRQDCVSGLRYAGTDRQASAQEMAADEGHA